MSNLIEIKKRLPLDCKILAVSKLQTTQKIRALFEQGQNDFAENYAQEFLDKQKQLSDLPICWHFIGHLQTNKINSILNSFSTIQSVDSFHLAEKLNQKIIQQINKAASKPNWPVEKVSDSRHPISKQKIFLQLNLALEQSKGGFSESDFHSQIEKLTKFEGLEIVGLMTMPPIFENPQDSRPYFKKLRLLRDKYQNSIPSLNELSMGTSSDYLIAAEEGATYVRIGTALFGERMKP